MANKLPVGARAPQEIVTELFDKRLMEVSLAGVFNNRHGVLKHLIEQGLGGQELTDLEDVFSTANNDAYVALLDGSPEVQKEHDKWFHDLYVGGFKRLFGARAARRDMELRATHSSFDKHPLATPTFVGELPPHLLTDETTEALQHRLDYRYGKHGVLMGPPPVVMALYEDIAVSLRPSARTLIQGKTEVWQLETCTDLRGPSTARVAA